MFGANVGKSGSKLSKACTHGHEVINRELHNSIIVEGDAFEKKDSEAQLSYSSIRCETQA